MISGHLLKKNELLICLDMSKLDYHDELGQILEQGFESIKEIKCVSTLEALNDYRRQESRQVIKRKRSKLFHSCLMCLLSFCLVVLSVDLILSFSFVELAQLSFVLCSLLLLRQKNKEKTQQNVT
ncbi:hypothetical protein [Vibrio vulnificus]|uniref:hypothetical protein n=1 Tax=Vibrio vulnificus TaxID=672 RepID=UPI003242A410